MRDATRHIISIGLAFGLVSILFFLSLVINLPFIITVPLIASGLYFFFRHLSGFAAPAAMAARHSFAGYTILVAGILLLIQQSAAGDYKYGGWDAWCFWNLHAKFMAGGSAVWRNMFLNTFAEHTDYPLFLPALNGFFMRLAGGGSVVIIPYITGFCITLFVPVVIYLHLVARNLVVAALALFFFAQNSLYLAIGLVQYADTALALFFLCSIICLEASVTDKRYIALSAMCIGCGMWAKNEGVILALIFLAFNYKAFFAKENFAWFSTGMVLPLTAILLFKLHYAPVNDIISGQGKETFQQLFVPARYCLVGRHFTGSIQRNFLGVAIAFFLFFMACIVQKKWPEKQFFMLLACMLAYTMIYILSPQDLEWHLNTSLERLMHQLMPAMVFVLARTLSAVQFRWPRKQAVSSLP